MNKIITAFLLSIFLFAGCTSIFFPIDRDKIKFSIPVSSDVPLIDGTPDDKSWQKSKSVSMFITSAGFLAAPQTTVSAVTDKQDLYVLFKSDYTDPEKLKASCSQNNSDLITKDESVELFIDVSASKSSYYRIAVNTEGFYLTEFCESNIERKNKITIDGFAVRTYSDKKSWYAEIKIPLKSISAEIKSDTAWGMNFARNTKASVASSWTGTPRFNKPETFPLVSFGNNVPVYYVIHRADAFSADLKIFNNSEFDRNLKVAFTSDYFSLTENICVSANSSNVLTLQNKNPLTRFELNPYATKNITITLKDTETDKIMSSSFFKYNSSDAFDSMLNLFYVYPDDQLTLSFIGNPAYVDSIDSEIIKELGGKPLKKFRIDKNNLASPISINTEGFEPGRYILSTFYTDSKNDISFVTRKAFFIMPASGPKKVCTAPFTLDKDGVIISAEGTLFLPFTSTVAGKNNSIPPNAQEAFNVNCITQNNTSSDIYISQLNSLALKKQNGKTFYHFSDSETLLKKTEDYLQKKFIGQRLMTRIAHDAQMQWRMGTENDSSKVDNIEYLNILNSKIKKQNPDALTSIHINNILSLSNYENTADIIEISSSNSSYNRIIETGIEKDLNAIKASLKNKPYIFWIGATIPKPEFRNAENIRLASYFALLYGAKGLVYQMGVNGLPLSMTRHWSVYKGLGEEFMRLYPIIISKDKIPVSFISAANADIYFSIRKHENDFYIFAINKSQSSLNCEFSLSEKYSLISIEPVFENRKIKTDKNIFRDFFLPLEVHTYKLNVSENK